MHELSICTAITGIVEQHAAGRPVARVCVDVGGLRQVVPATLTSCWELVVRGGPLGGATLDVRHVPVELVCRACGATTTLEHPVFRCAGCGDVNVEVARGNELTVTSLVLEEG
ncbi:MAG: hydrogenase maturation nickel metallochaperone HypA [Gaiellales bacterium]